MHILAGAIIGMVVSVALTFVASRVIKRPLTWKDIAASAVAGIIGGSVATATLGVGAATTLRTVTAFAAGGATGSASGQVTDNVLHGEPVGKDLVKATAAGTAIGAATLGVGRAAGPVARHASRFFGRGGAAAASGHGNSFAGAAAGLDDAIVPVWRYVKNALAKDPKNEGAADDSPSGSSEASDAQNESELPPEFRDDADAFEQPADEAPVRPNQSSLGALGALRGL